MANEVTKAVAEEFEIGLKYRAPDLAAGETITVVTAAVDPAGLTLDGAASINAAGDTVSQNIKTGVAGVSYEVLFKVTTSAGHIYNRSGVDSILVKVV